MGMWRPQHGTDQLARQVIIGAKARLAGDLVHAVGTDLTGADPFQVGIRGNVSNFFLHQAAPRISAAASITARTILS